MTTPRRLPRRGVSVSAGQPRDRDPGPRSCQMGTRGPLSSVPLEFRPNRLSTSRRLSTEPGWTEPCPGSDALQPRPSIPGCKYGEDLAGGRRGHGERVVEMRGLEPLTPA